MATIQKHLMPAGTYYVGDLCYVIDENNGMGAREDWEEVCALMHPEVEGEEHPPAKYGKHTLTDGRNFCIFPTEYGDGEYQAWGLNGELGKLCVDSGTIGCIRVEDIKSFDEEGADELGMLVEFKDDFKCWDDDGTLHFGQITVETKEDGADNEEANDDWLSYESDVDENEEDEAY